MPRKIVNRQRGRNRLAVNSKLKAQVQRAITAAGGMRSLARAIGTTHQNISQWKRIPAEWVPRIERVTGIPRTELRPDLYPS